MAASKKKKTKSSKTVKKKVAAKKKAKKKTSTQKNKAAVKKSRSSKKKTAPKKSPSKKATKKKKTGSHDRQKALSATLEEKELQPTSNSDLQALFTNDEEQARSKGLPFFKRKSEPEKTPAGAIEKSRKLPWGKISVAAIVLISATTYYTINHTLKSSLAVETGELKVAGLLKPAEIRRDSLGIPYVRASTQGDLFFAAGYAQAADRLWQIIATKMLAQGRLSEVVGKSAIDIDIFMRTLNIRNISREEFKKMPSKLQRYFRRYSEGVNAYIENNKLPPEFSITEHKPEPWQPEDSLCAYAMMNLTLATNYLEELAFLVLAKKVGLEKAAFLVPNYHDEPLPFNELEKLKGINLKTAYHIPAGHLEYISRYISAGLPASNNWAVSSSRTRNRKSLLANDTHLGISNPNSWVIMHLKAPGYDAAGVMVPGTPFIALGANRKIAWGATMVMADNQDVFLEKLKTVNNKRYYLHNATWKPVIVREELIRVKDSGDVNIQIESTIHGP